jgi:hypothetical protein
MHIWKALFIAKDENTKKMSFSAVFQLRRVLKVFSIGFSPITRARA